MRNIVIGLLIGLCFVLAAMMRYPVGEPVPQSVYTAQFEKDGIYKYMQTSFDPNHPRQLQAAPDDWIKQFGNNERTMLFYTVSELRIRQAILSKRLLALEKLARPEGPVGDCVRNDPNASDCGRCHK